MANQMVPGTLENSAPGFHLILKENRFHVEAVKINPHRHKKQFESMQALADKFNQTLAANWEKVSEKWEAKLEDTKKKLRRYKDKLMIERLENGKLAKEKEKLEGKWKKKLAAVENHWKESQNKKERLLEEKVQENLKKEKVRMLEFLRKIKVASGYHREGEAEGADLLDIEELDKVVGHVTKLVDVGAASMVKKQKEAIEKALDLFRQGQTVLNELGDPKALQQSDTPKTEPGV